MNKSQEFDMILSGVDQALLYNTSEVEEEVRTHIDHILERLNLGSLKSTVQVDRDGTPVVTIKDEELGDDSELSFTIVEDESNCTYIAVLDESDDNTTLMEVDESLWWTTILKLSGRPTHSDITRLITGDLLESVLMDGVFLDGEESLDEKIVTQVHGGQKIRKVVRSVKKRQTPAQKAALVKARRKAHTSSAARARKISMKVRKRSVH
jgi:hypothetical protein